MNHPSKFNNVELWDKGNVCDWRKGNLHLAQGPVKVQIAGRLEVTVTSEVSVTLWASALLHSRPTTLRGSYIWPVSD